MNPLAAGLRPPERVGERGIAGSAQSVFRYHDLLEDVGKSEGGSLNGPENLVPRAEQPPRPLLPLGLPSHNQDALGLLCSYHCGVCQSFWAREGLHLLQCCFPAPKGLHLT